MARRPREAAAGALIAIRPAEVTLALYCYARRYGRVWHAICTSTVRRRGLTPLHESGTM